MNMAIAFFVGCITFVSTMIVKRPIKKVNALLAAYISVNEEQEYMLYKRLNVVIMVIAMLIAMLSYYWTMQVLGMGHIKWCCSLKSGAIAIFIYTVYEMLMME